MLITGLYWEKTEPHYLVSVIIEHICILNYLKYYNSNHLNLSQLDNFVLIFNHIQQLHSL